VRVAAAFDHQASDLVAFRVEIENDTDHPIEVGPENVAFASCRDDKSCAAALWVIDPEEVLTSLDSQRSREKANATNEQIAGGALLFLGAAGDVAAASRGRSSNSAIGIGAEMNASAARSAVTLSNIDAQQAIWSTAALRKTTLSPGRGTSGFVFIPVDTKAEYVWLQVYQGPSKFSFHFRQTVQPVWQPAGPSRQFR